MQKYSLIFMILLTALLFLPEMIKAQWTNPYETYRTNDLIRRTPKKKTVQKSVKKTNRINRNKTLKKHARKKKVISQLLKCRNERLKFNSSRGLN